MNDLSFTQQYLQKIAIVGETGSGKTSLLKMISGWVQPDAGTIFFKNDRVLGPNEQLIPGRKEIAYLSQQYELRNNYWVHEVLSYANELTVEEANRLFAVCRIEHLLSRRTDQLSGGEKQRIALTRLLLSSPELLLLDEPFSNLDRAHTNIIKSVIADISTTLGITVLLVSHDAQDVLDWSDSLIILKDGKIIQQGSPQEVYKKPVNAYCAELLGDFNLVDNRFINLLSIPGFSEQGNNRFLVRPEHIEIVAGGENSVSGIVQRISFMGNYYLLYILVHQELLKVQITNANYRLGDLVFLSVARKT